MDKADIQRKIEEEEDYVHCPRLSNSLKKFLYRNPEGSKDSVIAKLLMIPEERVQEIYDEAVSKIRSIMVK